MISVPLARLGDLCPSRETVISVVLARLIPERDGISAVGGGDGLCTATQCQAQATCNRPESLSGARRTVRAVRGGATGPSPVFFGDRREGEGVDA